MIKRESDKLVVAQAYMEKGKTYTQTRNFQKALALYNEAIRTNRSPETLFNRAYFFNEIGNYPNAIADYSAAIQLKPNYPQAFINRGSSRSSAQDYQGALADYNQAIKLEPRIALSYRNRGALLIELGSHHTAINDFTIFLRMFPDDAYSYERRAFARLRTGDRDGAITDYKVAYDIYKQQGAVMEAQNARVALQNLNVNVY